MGHADRFVQHRFIVVDMDLTGAFEGHSLSELSGEISSSRGSLTLKKDDQPITSDYSNLQAQHRSRARAGGTQGTKSEEDFRLNRLYAQYRRLLASGVSRFCLLVSYSR